jgi:hypothetical protein
MTKNKKSQQRKIRNKQFSKHIRKLSNDIQRIRYEKRLFEQSRYISIKNQYPKPKKKNSLMNDHDALRKLYNKKLEEQRISKIRRENWSRRYVPNARVENFEKKSKINNIGHKIELKTDSPMKDHDALRKLYNKKLEEQRISKIRGENWSKRYVPNARAGYFEKKHRVSE